MSNLAGLKINIILMKSKVTFDLDESNNPIIKAEIHLTDDIRDKVATRFNEGFGYTSNLAIVKFGSIEREGFKYSVKILEISPLSEIRDESMDVRRKVLYGISTNQLEELVSAFNHELEIRNNETYPGKPHHHVRCKSVGAK